MQTHICLLGRSLLLFCHCFTSAASVCHILSLVFPLVSLSHSSSSSQHTVIEGQTHHGLLVAAIFPLDLPGLNTPQAS